MILLEGDDVDPSINSGLYSSKWVGLFKKDKPNPFFSVLVFYFIGVVFSNTKLDEKLLFSLILFNDLSLCKFKEFWVGVLGSDSN